MDGTLHGAAFRIQFNIPIIHEAVQDSTHWLNEFRKLAVKRLDVLIEICRNCDKDDTEYEYYAHCDF